MQSSVTRRSTSNSSWPLIGALGALAVAGGTMLGMWWNGRRKKRCGPDRCCVLEEIKQKRRENPDQVEPGGANDQRRSVGSDQVADELLVHISGKFYQYQKPDGTIVTYTRDEKTNEWVTTEEKDPEEIKRTTKNHHQVLQSIGKALEESLKESGASFEELPPLAPEDPPGSSQDQRPSPAHHTDEEAESVQSTERTQSPSTPPLSSPHPEDEETDENLP